MAGCLEPLRSSGWKEAGNDEQFAKVDAFRLVDVEHVNGGRPASGPARGWRPSCPLFAPSQQNARLGLKDGDEMPRHHVHLIFAALLGRPLPLVALVG